MLASLRCSLAFAGSLLVVAAGSAGCLPHTAEDHTGPTTCAADEFESNNTQETAHDLGGLKDDPDTAKSLTATVHRGDDVDWYRVHISDTGLGGNPNVSVIVPGGFEVTTWFVCDQGHVDTQCLQGSSEYMTVEGVDGCRGAVPEPTMDENGAISSTTDVVVYSTTDCSGTSDDNGTLYIKVERSASVASTCTYDLSVKVD